MTLADRIIAGTLRCQSCCKLSTQMGSKTKFVLGLRRRVCSKCADAMNANHPLERASKKPAAVKSVRITPAKRMPKFEHMADVTALVTRQPRTLSELQTVTGYGENAIRLYLKALAGEGLVASVGGGNKPIIWTWQ